MRNPGRLG